MAPLGGEELHEVNPEGISGNREARLLGGKQPEEHQNERTAPGDHHQLFFFLVALLLSHLIFA